MSNVRGLFDGNNDDDKKKKDESNNRFVGGIGDRGGGSGLAVEPNNADDSDDDSAGEGIGAVFGRAEAATGDDREQTRRTITMYRDGFVVDDGPYRRLDDPANAEFLRALAMGRTPRELVEDSEGGGDVVVGLVDKRKEDYTEEFRSFSGQGTSLGTTTTSAASGGVFDPANMPAASSDNIAADPTTSIAVRLLNGKRKIVKLSLSATVSDLATQLVQEAEGATFRLAAGFPPKPIEDVSATIEAAGLKGAQVSMQKAG